MLEEAKLSAQETTTQHVKEIVYYRSQALYKQLAGILDYSAYHADIESHTEILQG
jgi:hypothetical protein